MHVVHQMWALMLVGGVWWRKNIFSTSVLVFRRVILSRRGSLAETVYIIM